MNHNAQYQYNNIHNGTKLQQQQRHQRQSVPGLYGMVGVTSALLLLLTLPYLNLGTYSISHVFSGTGASKCLCPQTSSSTAVAAAEYSNEQTAGELMDDGEEFPALNATVPSISDWAAFAGQSDVESYTSRILRQIRRNGTTACHNATTEGTRILGLNLREGPVRVPTDKTFRFKLLSVDDVGNPRCAGGDYYELELSGEHWKSRPTISDNDDGTYDVSFLVDGTKPGLYNFTARLLFSNLHGLDFVTLSWARDSEPVAVSAEFLLESSDRRNSAEAGGVITSQLRRCTPDDMKRAGGGGGRWTRGGYNATCRANVDDGRWQCLSPPHDACEAPWCDGHVAALESNGWVYSDKSCGFHIFTTEEAWQCLSGRWLFMWGDSNMLDFLRNLLIFGLNYPPPTWANISTWEMNRVVEQPLFVNPNRPDQTLRVSYVFNGHYDTDGDWLGLASMQNSSYRDYLKHFFNGSFGHPDTFIFNTGLHDGLHFESVSDFADAVSETADFWSDVFRPLTEAVKKKMRFLLRTTIAPAGPPRWNKSNPQKMEVFNGVLLEGFRRRFANLHVIDAFDMSFPFHYDFSCSDGGHYGRPPGIKRWPWFDQPHHYFVEVMLVHAMLNSICSPPSSSVASSPTI